MTILDRLSQRLGAFPVELPAALLAACAAGLWAFAAATPLGDAARLLLALAGAALVFALTWAGLRALEPRRADPAGMPRFRKADLHPDAPRRRPIRAGAEFGSPQPGAMGGLAAGSSDPGYASVPLPSFLQPPEAGATGGEPIRFVDDVVRDVPDGVYVEREPIWFRPPTVEDSVEDAEWSEVSDAAVAPPPAPAPAPVPPPSIRPASAEDSVSELMARLEAALARTGGVPPRPVPDDETRAALRAVADDLRAIAGLRARVSQLTG